VSMIETRMIPYYSSSGEWCYILSGIQPDIPQINTIHLYPWAFVKVSEGIKTIFRCFLSSLKVSIFLLVERQIIGTI